MILNEINQDNFIKSLKHFCKIYDKLKNNDPIKASLEYNLILKNDYRETLAKEDDFRIKIEKVLDDFNSEDSCVSCSG